MNRLQGLLEELRESDPQPRPTHEDIVHFGDQGVKVRNVVKDGAWRTLSQITKESGVPREGSVASRLRDMKATGKWSYRRRKTNIPGIWEYQVYPL